MTELLLRHWLAAGGIDPATQVRFEAISPLAMQGSLRKGQIDAFIAGRYRVAAAMQERHGQVLATDREIWEDHPEKVLSCGEIWASSHPEALLALCTGLMRAAERCDDSGERDALVQVLSQHQWLGQRASGALSRQFDRDDGHGLPMRFNHFHADRAHRSDPAEGCWILTQLSRWGWCPFPANRLEILSQVYRPELYQRALEQAGFAALPLSRRAFRLADGLAFDQDDPLGYLARLPDQPSPSVRPLPLQEPAAAGLPTSSLR
jgi:nitrate/nitrite transport system ATP-binding protein